MTNLSRRLRKLEAGILDSHGLIPNTPEWLDFWEEKLESVGRGGRCGSHGHDVGRCRCDHRSWQGEEAEAMAVQASGSERFV